MSYKDLTTKQQRFADNVLSGIDGKNSYIKAGYKARGSVAESAASRLLRNAKVAAYINEQRAKAAYAAEISCERVLKEEKCIAYSMVGSIFELKNGTLIAPSELPEEVQRSIAGIEITETEIAGVKKLKYKYKFWDKGRSLERLGKHLGMYEKDNTQRKPDFDGFAIVPVKATERNPLESPEKDE